MQTWLWFYRILVRHHSGVHITQKLLMPMYEVVSAAPKFEMDGKRKPVDQMAIQSSPYVLGTIRSITSNCSIVFFFGGGDHKKKTLLCKYLS